MRWPRKKRKVGVRVRSAPNAVVELIFERDGEPEPVYAVRLTVANADRLADDLMKAAGEAAMGSTRALKPWEG